MSMFRNEEYPPTRFATVVLTVLIPCAAAIALFYAGSDASVGTKYVILGLAVTACLATLKWVQKWTWWSVGALAAAFVALPPLLSYLTGG